MSNARLRKLRSGFTLLEALAAVALLGVGIVGSVSAFGTVIQTEDRARQREHMQRLAEDKLAELMATGQATTSSNGDFQDQNEPNYTWRLEVNTSGITDLNSVTLTVERSNNNDKARLDTLVYVPPTTSTTAGSTGGTTGQ